MKVTGILVVAGLGVCAGTCGAADRPTAEELVARAKKGPSLLLTREGAEAARRRVAADADAGRWLRALRQRLDARMTEPPQIFAHGGQWVMWLNCRKCATRLRSESPTRHVCLACGEAHSGWPYDDAYISTVNNANGVEVRDCGVAWLLTGERRYAERARDVLAGYARAYGGYEWHQRNGPEKPGRNSAARAYAQVLDEAVWLSNLLDGYDAVREALTDADRRLIEEKLIRPSTETVRSECARWSNHEVWHLVAFGRAGLVLGDVRLVDAALNGPYGALNQLEHGILGDGTWYEGAMHYHFYTMRAFTPFFRVLHNLGYAVPDRYRRMFLAPIEQLPPDELMPQVNDSCQLEYLHPGDLPQHYELANGWWDEPTFRWWVRQQPRATMDQYNLPPLLKGDESWAWVENPRQRPVGEAWHVAWRRPGATLGLWQRASSAGTLATGVGSAMPPPAQMTLAVNRVKGRRAAFASVVVPDAGARVEIGPITATADGWRGFEAKVNGRRHVLRVRRGASPRLEAE